MKRKPIDVEEKSPSGNKDWRDAFVEAGVIKREQCVEYSLANAVRIEECNVCSDYGLLCLYVGQFESGGFWYDSAGLHFVTYCVNSDKEATYEDAVLFLRRYGAWKD